MMRSRLKGQLEQGFLGQQRLRSGTTGRLSRATAVCVALVGLACSDGATEDGADTPKAVKSAVSPELLAQTWPVRMADDTTRAPFEGHPGWGALFKRDLPGALAAFKANPGDGRGLARVHADLAALYGQATWMGAQATGHIYGKDRQDTDPLEAAYMLGVAKGIMGDCAGATESLAALAAPPEALQKHHAWWTTWASADGCPGAIAHTDLQGLPNTPAVVEAGTDPELPPLPHLTFTERSEDSRDVHAGELTHLLALSAGHRAASLAAAPEAERGLAAARMVPWQLPVDPLADPSAELPQVHDEWLFLDFALVGADHYFLDAAKRDGLTAIDAWKDRSVLAAVLQPAVTPEGLNVETVIDRAADLRIQLKAAMLEASGSPKSFHPPFAQMGEVAVLRAGMIIADANDQYRDAGILRINAFERSDGPSRDPVFLLSTAAWDAGNRSPLRAQEIVHGLVSRYPSIRAARYPLDALHIRLGRTAAPTTAVH